MREPRFDPMLGKMDDEDCFGFHSEYYVDPEWRKAGSGYGKGWWEYCRGYSACSKYQDDIYFIPYYYITTPDNGGFYIIKSNVKQKTSSAVRLATQKVFDSNTYIAVNRRGYFLYDVEKVTLFGFDGHEIYTHKFGRKVRHGDVDHMESIYIYDDKVIYSETKQAEKSTKIFCVDMRTQEKWLVWGSQKGDSVFDDYLRDSYQREWGTEWPFPKAPSEMGTVSCRFLYANKHRVIAGYSREYRRKEKTAGYYTPQNNYYSVSYIVNIDLAENKYSVLDCFIGLDRFSEKGKVSLPSWDDRHIFSFNMLDDTMWVKTSDKDIRLVHTDIQRVTQLRGRYPADWKLCAFTDIHCRFPVEAEYYHFDGRFACTSSGGGELRFTPDGGWEEIDSHPYNDHNLRFWCFDGIYLVPNEYNEYVFRNAANGNVEYSLRTRCYDDGVITVEKLIQNAEQPKPKAKAESRKAEPSEHTEPVRSADDDRAILAMAKKAVDDALSMDTSGYHYSEDQIKSFVQIAIGLIRQQAHEAPPGDEVPGHKEKKDGRGVVDGSRLTLAEFRQNAPSMTGFREQLLAYRKSLPNNWDYNAFVGILLGVGGPKHGDAACMNFAIGQGDNGKNTKKTLETKGLMPVFEKYKGKKIDETILLSDVEDEIIAIAPEYAPIRQKLHEILRG